MLTSCLQEPRTMEQTGIPQVHGKGHWGEMEWNVLLTILTMRLCMLSFITGQFINLPIEDFLLLHILSLKTPDQECMKPGNGLHLTLWIRIITIHYWLVNP